ncbi:hypothetical protein I7648_05525 [Collinsella tanakaei]|nr:hypothetical protein [Collinsella tanakaei]
MSFYDDISGIMADMDKAARISASSRNAIADEKRNAAKQLDAGVWGEAGYSAKIRELDEREQAVALSFEQAVSDALDKFERVKGETFGVKPRQLDSEFCNMLNMVDLTEDEAFTLFRNCKMEGQHTKARAVCKAAQAAGIDIVNDTPRYIEAAERAVNEFAEYCRSLSTGGSSADAYANAWDQITESILNRLKDSESDWMAGTYAHEETAA